MAGCESGAFTGRDSALYYCIGCPGNQPTLADYKRLGMMRGKTMEVSWDNADATGDMSAANTKETLVTYKNVTFSGDGVSRKEAVYNQKAVKQHAYNPSDTTNNQPYIWLKFITPIDVTEGCFTITSWSDEAPHDDVATWSTECSSTGIVSVRDRTEVIVITTQPSGQTLAVGDTLNLSVVARSSDNSAMTYQWKKDGESISGATSATYTKTDVATTDAGAYTVSISSASAGTTTSNEAAVTITD
ncbi:hypothetical protein CG651_001195 [Salmonella enterica]|nr:hypothetical protein [Salmonella enterica]